MKEQADFIKEVKKQTIMLRKEFKAAKQRMNDHYVEKLQKLQSESSEGKDKNEQSHVMDIYKIVLVTFAVLLIASALKFAFFI
jgi:uncharacterized membrane protein (DUF106 family)